MIFSCFTQKLKENVGELLGGGGGGGKGYVAPLPKLLVGPGPLTPPPLPTPMNNDNNNDNYDTDKGKYMYTRVILKEFDLFIALLYFIISFFFYLNSNSQMQTRM